MKSNTGIPEEIYEPQYDYDIDDHDSSDRDESLLTNFDIDKRPLYEKAIKEYERKFPEKVGKLYISDSAYAIWGGAIEGCNSLHCRENMDYTDFWRIKESLEKESEN